MLSNRLKLRFSEVLTLILHELLAGVSVEIGGGDQVLLKLNLVCPLWRFPHVHARIVCLTDNLILKLGGLKVIHLGQPLRRGRQIILQGKVVAVHLQLGRATLHETELRLYRRRVANYRDLWDKSSWAHIAHLF